MDADTESDAVIADEIFDPAPEDILKLLPIFDDCIGNTTAVCCCEIGGPVLDVTVIVDVVSGDFELLIRRKNFVNALCFDFCSC